MRKRKLKTLTAGIAGAIDRPPARLWLQWHGDSEPMDAPISVLDVTWSREKIWPHDVEYVRVPNCVNNLPDP